MLVISPPALGNCATSSAVKAVFWLGSVLISGAVPDTSTVSVPLATDSSTSTFEVWPT